MENEETKEEQPQEATSMVQEAHKAAEELKAQNKIMTENIKKQEELNALQMLGGSSQGAPQEAVKKEQTPQEYYQAIKRGEVKYKD